MLSKLWYSKNPIALLLLPFSYLYQFCYKVHKLIYALGIKKIYRSPVPVIVVGNLTVGGTGKTPFVIALANLLSRQGYKPGIISRGYKGKLKTYPKLITEADDPTQTGDEPAFIVKKTSLPLAISPNRAESIDLLTKSNLCDVIISDDGLQHHAIKKDIEIVLVDGERHFGNRFCLPAGPLRESVKRLNDVDFMVLHQSSLLADYSMTLKTQSIYNLCEPGKKFDYQKYSSVSVHAVAAIGSPNRFFSTLTKLGINFIPHTFKDHHPFRKEDFNFCNDDDLIIMTEKDAIKCKKFARPNFWILPVEACLSDKLVNSLLEKLAALMEGRGIKVTDMLC